MPSVVTTGLGSPRRASSYNMLNGAGESIFLSTQLNSPRKPRPVTSSDLSSPKKNSKTCFNLDQAQLVWLWHSNFPSKGGSQTQPVHSPPSSSLPLHLCDPKRKIPMSCISFPEQQEIHPSLMPASALSFLGPSFQQQGEQSNLGNWPRYKQIFPPFPLKEWISCRKPVCMGRVRRGRKQKRMN